MSVLRYSLLACLLIASLQVFAQIDAPGALSNPQSALTMFFENLDDDNFKLNEQMISVLEHLDIGRFVSSPSMWAGLLVCGLLSFAAIYVRRFRDES